MADVEPLRRAYEMAKRKNFPIGGFVAAMQKRDPKECWLPKPAIDHDKFKRLPGSTRYPTVSEFLAASEPTASKVGRKRNESRVEMSGKGREVSENSAATSANVETMRKRKEAESKNPAASKVERKRKQKGNKAESKNLAGKANGINNNLGLDIEDDVGNPTIVELLRNPRALKVKKNKKTLTALQVEEPTLDADIPWPPIQVPWMRNPVAWDPEDLVCSINKNPAEFSTQAAKKYMRRVFN